MGKLTAEQKVREAFNQGYGIIDATPMFVRRSPPQ